ncbi:MAG: bifunctional diaminohydroxyphosphoribosylaminopyrimidine deaminase/5-amino-6-(5-phosphoribosylamino)uracil reductase RibD [Nitrospiria bacterium]
MSHEQDLVYIKQALALARRGYGKASPNPMVGAVLVKRGAVIGKGFHLGPGRPHAEALALEQAGRRSKGATLYTNLEPCCHTQKRTPPCSHAIIQSGVQKVVSSMADPNPLVSGKGFATLRQSGIEVREGLMRLEAEGLNEAFIKFMTTQKPLVILKAAMTLDGRIATGKGKSRWITGEAARKEVHRLRAGVDAVMVGIGTVLADDPMLTVRHRRVRNPLRVVIDSDLKIPLKSKLVTSLAEAETLLITTSKAPVKKAEKLSAMGLSICSLPSRKREIPFRSILKALGKRGIISVLVEGGGQVNGIALRSGEVDRVIFYVAPKLLCGEDARGVVSGRSIPLLSNAIGLDQFKIGRVGEDLRIEGYLHKRVGLQDQIPGGKP